MLTFIVPPFFWPGDDAAEGLLDAVPAKAAATNIAAPIAPIAPESHTRLRIGLLSEGVSMSAFRRGVEFFVSPASISFAGHSIAFWNRAPRSTGPERVAQSIVETAGRTITTRYGFWGQ